VPLTSTVEILSRAPHYDGRMVKAMMANTAPADAALETRPDFAMPPKKTARFPRAARLLRHADFERVYKQGRRHFSASITVFYWPRPELEARASGLRVGFTVGRALGGAVQRNRMKRRLREAVRMSLPDATIAADVVINPKKSLLTTDFGAVRNEVTRAFAVIEQKLSAPETSKNTIAGARSPRPESRS
jgi:ribonuclease P protein component